MQTTRFCTVDLAKIRGKGEFRCPKCHAEIFPDDRTENTYRILEPIMKGNCLEKLIIRCNRCGTMIQLSGFNVLSKMA